MCHVCLHLFLLSSVSKLAEVLREAIEDEVKILHELTLPGTQFTINEVQLLGLLLMLMLLLLLLLFVFTVRMCKTNMLILPKGIYFV